MSNHCTLYPCQSIDPPDPIQFENGGKAKDLELKDSFTLQDYKLSLKQYFSADYYREIPPQMRYDHFLGDPRVKYEKQKDGSEWVTLNGQRMQITEELKVYVNLEDLRWRTDDILRHAQIPRVAQANHLSTESKSFENWLAKAKLFYR